MKGAKKICIHPRCGKVFAGPGKYCDKHKPDFKRKWDKKRGNSAKRGYGYEWRKIRLEVLKASGIPVEKWPDYDVDHNPPYNKDVEPDHRKYNLIPRLRADHSRKTASQDGGFGNKLT